MVLSEIFLPCCLLREAISTLLLVNSCLQYFSRIWVTFGLLSCKMLPQIVKFLGGFMEILMVYVVIGTYSVLC